MSFFKQNFLNYDSFFTKDELNSGFKKALEYYDKMELPEGLKICSSTLEKDQDIKSICSIAESIKDRNIVILGIGGSSLGGQFLASFSRNNRIHFFDNIDIEKFSDILNIKDPFFIVISKSGETSETIMQLAYILTENFNWRNNVIILTENKNSSLVRIANSYGVNVIEHSKKIGGRYSIFSNVGMIIACLCGLDINLLREKAASVYMNLKTDIIYGALYNYLFFKKRFDTSAMLLYSDRLELFGEWWQQLWAESLGKNNFGSTPISLVGVTFQHSIMQLFLDGPKNKIFTVIHEKTNFNPKFNPNNDVFLCSEKTNYLRDKNMKDLFCAEREAVLCSLQKCNLPVREIILDFSNYDDSCVAELLAYFILETVLTGLLFGINPYDQNAVELVKIATKEKIFDHST